MTERLGGRRAEAARNDVRILNAARAVFVADPDAPITRVAERAGVGISALYRRYPSKEILLHELARDGLARFGHDLRQALDEHGDPWQSYVDCLHRVVDGKSQALAQSLAGTFSPTPGLTALATEVGTLYRRLHDRTRRAGALRRDVTAADVIVLLEMIMQVELPGADGGAAMRRRYLALVLESLHDTSAARLPGRGVRDGELAARWRPQPSSSST